MNDIQILHAYNRLARREILDPLECERCEEQIVVRVDEDGEPLLQCFECGTKTRPGALFMMRVQQAVEGKL